VISDVLFEAEAGIRDYMQRMPDVYPANDRALALVLDIMKAIRNRPGFDRPPTADCTLHADVHAAVARFDPEPAATARKLRDVVGVLVAALDDASSVVDAGEDEAYAYQAELELGRAVLGEVPA
jgi:hypothetical protein